MKYDPYHNYELEKLDTAEMVEAEITNIPISEPDTGFVDQKKDADTIQIPEKYISDLAITGLTDQTDSAGDYEPRVLLSYFGSSLGLYLRGITLGMGYTFVKNNYWGGDINIKSNIIRSRNVPMDYYDDGYRIIHPKDYVNILSFNVVKEFIIPQKSMRLGLEAGPSWVNYRKAEFEANPNYNSDSDPDVNWVYKIGTKYKYYKDHHGSNTIGVSLKAKIVILKRSSSGVELSVFGNINNLKSVAGLDFALIFGKVKN
jgi:hypothetical protein